MKCVSRRASSSMQRPVAAGESQPLFSRLQRDSIFVWRSPRCHSTPAATNTWSPSRKTTTTLFSRRHIERLRTRLHAPRRVRATNGRGAPNPRNGFQRGGTFRIPSLERARPATLLPVEENTQRTRGDAPATRHLTSSEVPVFWRLGSVRAPLGSPRPLLGSMKSAFPGHSQRASPRIPSSSALSWSVKSEAR